MSNLNVKLIIEAIDKMTEPVRRMRGTFITSMKEMAEHVEALGKKITHLGREISHIGKFFTERLTLPIAAFGALAIHEAANVEELEARFRGLAGGAKQAGDFVKRLMDFSHKSPFEMDDISEAAEQMMGMGYSVDSTMKRLKFLGDIAAGTGKPLNDIVSKYLEIRIAGKASMEDLTGMTREGIPVIKALADQMHISERRVLYMAEAGTISFARVKKAMEDMTKQGGLYANSMDDAGKSITGVFKELKKTIADSFGDVGQTIYSQLKMGDKIQRISQIIKDLAKSFMALPEPVKNFIANAALITAVLGPIIFAIGQFFMSIGYIGMGLGFLAKGIMFVLPFIATLTEAFISFGIVLLTTPLGWIILGIAALAIAGYELIKHWQAVKEWFAAIWADIKGIFSIEIDAIMNFLQPLLDAVAAVKSSWNGLKDFATNNALTQSVEHVFGKSAAPSSSAGSSTAASSPATASGSSASPHVTPAIPVGLAQRGQVPVQTVDTGGVLKIQIDSDNNVKNVSAKPNDKRMGYTVDTGLMMGAY